MRACDTVWHNILDERLRLAETQAIELFYDNALSG